MSSERWATGSSGCTLERIEQPYFTEVHAVDKCQGCGLSLIDTPVLKWELSQVHDLPALHLQVTEHRSEIKCCPHCQTLNRGAMPSDITSGVQYGSRLKGFMAYLSDYQLLPSQRTIELLSDVLGCNISEGTLYNARQVKQKISSGFRSLFGGQIFCRTRGYIFTLKKQKLNILDELRKVFMGNPTMPVLVT